MGMKHLVLETRHAEAGARFVPFAGFSMPIQYSGILEEHRAVRTRAGLFDVSHMGEVWVRGPRAMHVVDGLVTQDISTMTDGQARYALLCNPHGGIVDDLLVYRLSSEEFLLCVNAANREKDFTFLLEHAGEGAELVDESDQWCQFAVQGPRSEAIVAQTTDTDVARVAYYHFEQGSVAGVSSIISRTGYTGEDGFEIYTRVEDAAQVFDALRNAGAADDMLLCGLGCRDTLRLEARLHLYGQDMDEETNPFEAGLSWTVKLDKESDFIGKDALRDLKSKGVTRRLRGFVLKGKGVPRPGYDVVLEGERIGALTSGSYSPVLDTGIGLGYVDVAHAKKTSVEIQIRKRRVAARMTRKAFYDRNAS